jgi:citrate synthase
MGTDTDTSTSGAGKAFLSSGEVVERLGISKSTLYAYVSRGLIRSAPDPDSPRSRRYRADDVERLLNRQRMRADPEAATTTALDWGSPVMDSSISTIFDERLAYRDHDAVELARSHTFEDVIGLLWTGGFDSDLPTPDDASAFIRNELLQQSTSLARSLDAPARMQMLLPAMEQRDATSYDFRPEAVHKTGINALQMFTAAIVGTEGHSGIARTLQAHWSPGQSSVSGLIDAALILSADHELNISTFTVRCIASSRAPLYSALTGGLSALRGQKHGGATLQTEALIREVGRPEDARDAIRNRLQRGDALAGFGHRLYPSGDPRGVVLLEMIQDEFENSDELKLANAICETAGEFSGLKPNLEFALVTLCRVLGQSGGTALALMALGRMAGWVAHAAEEYERDQLIRPRARRAGEDD